MNQFQPRHYMWRYWAMGLAVCSSIARSRTTGSPGC
jgi:hypothetical protein